MYLAAAERKSIGMRDANAIGEQGRSASSVGGLAGLVLAGWRWMKARGLEQKRSSPAKQLHLLETLVLGSKQRVVLMRCGAARFLVGVGAEGVTTVVRVEESAGPGELPHAASRDGAWG